MSSSVTRPIVCFVAHNAYGAMSARSTGHIGGIERQQAMMARWLAERGYVVKLITWDEGQTQDTMIDGVTVIKLCGRESGLPGLRFVHPRWTSLVRALARADADIYYQNCGEYVTGQVAAWCRRHGRRFVYSVASDPDVDVNLPAMKTIRERVLYRYGLRHADRVVTQTRQQQEQLRAGWGIAATTLPMPCVDQTGPAQPVSFRSWSDPPKVLWIGRIGPEKRLEWMLDVAQRCPELHFSVVGSPYAENAYTRFLVARAGGIRNVTMHGYVSHADTSRYYGESAVLCCTSSYEGFPNTFLEAWRRGVPVVSTVDPDGLIAEKGLGRIAGDVPRMVIALRDLLGNSQQWSEASRNGFRYFYEHHRPEIALPKFEQVFLEVANGLSRSGVH
jgi:glycosyltransferase involved in cell wall biosynthesis